MRRCHTHIVNKNAVRGLAVLVFGVMLSNGVAAAQDFSRYRFFRLGTSLSSVARDANLGPSDATVIHQRSALIQELAWRPQYQSLSTRLAMDPVLDVTLTFYNDQLFRIVITYDEWRTDGMTSADIVEAVSASYGRAAVPATPQGSHTSPTDPITIARWANGDRTLTLSRTVFPVVFQLVMVTTTLNDLAEAAVTDAVTGPDRAARVTRNAGRSSNELGDRLPAEDRRRQNKAAFHP